MIRPWQDHKEQNDGQKSCTNNSVKQKDHNKTMTRPQGIGQWLKKLHYSNAKWKYHKDKGDGHESCININIRQEDHEKTTMNKVMAKRDVTIVMQGEKIMRKPWGASRWLKKLHQCNNTRWEDHKKTTRNKVMAKKVAPITTQNKKTMKTTKSKAMAKRATITTQDEKTIKTIIPKPQNPNYVTKIKIKFFHGFKK